MADKVITSTGDCSACCGGAPTECACALEIPPLASPYVDYATAAAAIADFTSGCVGYVDYGGGDMALSFTASFDGTTFRGHGHTEISSPSLGLGVDTYFCASLLSGAVISIPFTLTTDGSPFASASLMDCATGTEVDSDLITAASGTLTLTAPADGIYVISVRGLGSLGIVTSTDMDFTATCSTAWWVNPVIAQWDDSGTTRQLEACPKMYLPPLTESTGDWYADCTDAATAITDLTSNCVGFIESLTGVTTFTATDGGTSVTLLDLFSSPGITSPVMWCSVNAEVVEAIVVDLAGTFSGLPPSVSYAVTIYDYSGSVIESSGVVASPSTWTSSALPYSGRYIVSYYGGGGNALAVSAVVRSSGTLTVNPIQAIYDLGLDCGGRINCGDSC